MFTEYLQEHPLRELIAHRPRCPFPTADNRPAWEGLSEEKKAALLRLAGQYRDVAFPVLPASAFMAFGRTGDRACYEGPYFLRRRKLIAALMDICVTGSDAALDDVIDGVWLICEETSWVISAHNGSAHEGVLPPSQRLLPEADNPYIDLFAAQTAMILSLTCAMLGDRLDDACPLISRRIRQEIERRILRPFETRDDFWWMGITRKDLCNWTPWIVSNVMLTACAWIDDRLRLCDLLTRGCAMLDRYLDVIPDDGGCDEGPGYWSMAGGALLDCLELLERVTDGQMRLWDDAKLRNIMRFPLNAWLGGEWFINFADCDARPAIPGERLRFAGERLRDETLVGFGEIFGNTLESHISDTPQLWRLLNDLFHPADNTVPSVVPPDDVWLPDLQIRVLRRGGMTLVCKGGVNEGSHNHNDCGSFMVHVDGEPQIVDAGNMAYTGKTFSEARYTLWNTRAMYHNVPMIGDMEQVNGWERRAEDVHATPDCLSMDIAGAYPEDAGVTACRRTFTCDEDGCVLTDSITTAYPESVTEVFMLRHRPELIDGAIVSGKLIIRPDFDIFRPKSAYNVEEIPVTDPRMARNYPGSLWRVCLQTESAKRHALRFHIERNDL